MKIRNEAFVKYYDEYDNWFFENRNVYLSELEVFKQLDIRGKSLEVGVGTGRFALPLNIKYGLEPTRQMYEKLVNKISLVEGVAEFLPFKSESFDWVIMVTTICFVENPVFSLQECCRVLKTGGKIAVGFVDKESPIGRFYMRKKSKSKFYREATFYSTEEVMLLMQKGGLVINGVWQTVIGDMEYVKKEVQQPRRGFGDGSFVVILGEKYD